MSNEYEKVYIGDGVYARWDGMSVLLETERGNGTHYIYLEPHHVENLVKLMIIFENARCSFCGAKLDGTDECGLANCPHVGEVSAQAKLASTLTRKPK